MRLLSICPRVSKESGCVVATTAWRVRLASLGTLYRRVVVNPVSRSITITSRYAWLVNRQHEYRFSQIAGVTYGYGNLSMESYLSWGHDSIDSFSTGLRFKNSDKEVHLFTFIGEGTFSNDGPLPDWMYWQDFTFDLSGSQEQESKVFVNILSKMIGVKVVPPRI